MISNIRGHGIVVAKFDVVVHHRGHLSYTVAVWAALWVTAPEALLYEYDPAYRRRMAKARRASEQSFGAALRRLRKQRGLRREDFAPALSPKTLARIERGEVLPEHMHGSTWEILAEKLRVRPEEIATF